MGDVFAVSEGQHLKKHDLIRFLLASEKLTEKMCVSKCVKHINM